MMKNDDRRGKDDMGIGMELDSMMSKERRSYHFVES